MIDLYKLKDNINKTLDKKRKDLKLEFFEDEHKYSMINKNGEVSEDWISVSKIIKMFYEPFDSDRIAEMKSNGDKNEKERLLKEWEMAGLYSTNLGSRTHFFLEKKSLELFQIDKNLRQPVFECDYTQIIKSDSMITAGSNFLELMKQRGAVLLDTELVLGDNELSLVGQPDSVWLSENKSKTKPLFIITDFKTNKPKNFEVNKFTKKMKSPFDFVQDNSLGHYYLQLPLYGRILKKMLENTEYSDISLAGCIIVLLREDGKFEEFRVPNKIIDTVFNLNLKNYTKKLF
jgi:hypothetical protein